VFELQILLGNAVAPAAILLIGFFACRILPLDLRSRAIPFVLSACSGLAICVALAIRNGFAWWPEDAWQKVPAAALIVTAVAIIAESVRSRKTACTGVAPAQRVSPQTNSMAMAIVQWAGIAIAAACTAWLIFPRGDAWAELQSQQNQWCIVIALAASFGWWGVAGCHPPVASTVGLATIPLLIANAFVTSLSIMKVTEPLIAVATVIGLCSLIDLRLAGRRSLPMMIAPTLFAMSGFIAHASFQSYLGLPRALYLLTMLSPAIVALVARTAQRKSTRFAIGATVVLALMLAVAIGIWGYIAGEVGSADDW
jgi:hypothetical protein